jgi:hypothetical protein
MLEGITDELLNLPKRRICATEIPDILRKQGVLTVYWWHNSALLTFQRVFHEQKQWGLATRTLRSRRVHSRKYQEIVGSENECGEILIPSKHELSRFIAESRPKALWRLFCHL